MGTSFTYNELCPNLSCNSINGTPFAYTGCVATATAQIIKYWHPVNQYNYNYNSMPSNYGDLEVRRLMKDIGLPNNANMNYGCDGSSADGDNIGNVLKTNFGFSSENNVNYNYLRVQNNINSYQPVLLTGSRTATKHSFIINWWTSYSDCHQWVCDGRTTYNYTICENGQWIADGSYLYFHMNWGWHEYGSPTDYNGWFAFSNWNISTSNGNRNYQYSNGLTSEIHP
nr:C10 family peptidase [uncultured Flavobacterium sp.]